MDREVAISLEVNGRRCRATVPARMTAADFLRERLQLTGTHLGCEHGVCGACTVLVDGRSVRSCILYAPQLDDTSVVTVEGLDPVVAHPLQEAFEGQFALQCGFCTAGLLLTAHELLSERRGLEPAEVRAAISGNLCRCTNYEEIVRAVMLADERWDRATPTSDDRGST